MKKILIVDDETMFTRLVKLNLEQSGEYEVRVENQGTRALAAAQEFKPDLILLDIIMPDMEGSEAARQIRADEAFKDVPIAFLTATVMKEDVGTRGGVVEGFPVIAKPVTGEELLGHIRKLIKS